MGNWIWEHVQWIPSGIPKFGQGHVGMILQKDQAQILVKNATLISYNVISFKVSKKDSAYVNV